MNKQTQPPKKRSILTKVLIGVGAVLVACCGLSVVGALLTPRTKPAATPVISMQLADGSTVMPLATAVPVDTAITAPTFTPAPTQPPLPTATPAPADTPTAMPTPKAPIQQTGHGADVVTLPVDYGPAIVRLTHDGRANFAVQSYDANGERLDLMVNEIGKYDGVIELNMGMGWRDTPAARLSIEADGNWTVSVEPLSTARVADVPGVVEGAGDDVFWLKGAPDLLKAQSSGKGNFAVYAVQQSGSHDLLINEIGAYKGTMPLPRDTVLIIVKADGAWSFEITSP